MRYHRILARITICIVIGLMLTMSLPNFILSGQPSIALAAPKINITTTSLPDGEVGGLYSETISATGGVTPYS